MVIQIDAASDLKIRNFYHKLPIIHIVSVISVTRIVQLQFKPCISAATIQDAGVSTFHPLLTISNDHFNNIHWAFDLTYALVGMLALGQTLKVYNNFLLKAINII